MSPREQLKSALSAIDGNGLIQEFLGDEGALGAVAAGCDRVALWANSLREADSGNSAVPFLFEMQRSSHDVGILMAMSLYVPAAAAMRSMCETALYYSYFRGHPAELETLANCTDYYVTKAEVLSFHKQHSLAYKKASRAMGFPGVLDAWYSRVSGIVHGQLPGVWGTRLALAETRHVAAVRHDAIDTFTDGVAVLHSFLLMTVGHDLWGRFHFSAKRELLKGVPAERRALLGLDGK